MDRELTDQAVVRAALQDPKQYAAIVERYHAPLSRYIMRLGCRSTDDVKDVLQETFLKAYINLNDYDQGLKFSSWLYRIAHNETMSFFRKVKSNPAAIGLEEQMLLVERIGDSTDIAADADRKFEAEEVRKALESIDFKYREPLVLKFLEEKSYEEISDILKMPVGTVATLINRGKQKLKTALGNRGAS